MSDITIEPTEVSPSKPKESKLSPSCQFLMDFLDKTRKNSSTGESFTSLFALPKNPETASPEEIRENYRRGAQTILEHEKIASVKDQFVPEQVEMALTADLAFTSPEKRKVPTSTLLRVGYLIIDDIVKKRNLEEERRGCLLVSGGKGSVGESNKYARALKDCLQVQEMVIVHLSGEQQNIIESLDTEKSDLRQFLGRMLTNLEYLTNNRLTDSPGRFDLSFLQRQLNERMGQATIIVSEQKRKIEKLEESIRPGEKEGDRFVERCVSAIRGSDPASFQSAVEDALKDLRGTEWELFILFLKEMTTSPEFEKILKQTGEEHARYIDIKEGAEIVTRLGWRQEETKFRVGTQISRGGAHSIVVYEGFNCNTGEKVVFKLGEEERLHRELNTLHSIKGISPEVAKLIPEPTCLLLRRDGVFTPVLVMERARGTPLDNLCDSIQQGTHRPLTEQEVVRIFQRVLFLGKEMEREYSPEKRKYPEDRLTLGADPKMGRIFYDEESGGVKVIDWSVSVPPEGQEISEKRRTFEVLGTAMKGLLGLDNTLQRDGVLPKKKIRDFIQHCVGQDVKPFQTFQEASNLLETMVEK